MRVEKIEEIVLLKNSEIIEFICEKCRKEVSITKRKFIVDSGLKCGACKRKETNLKKYGFENPFQNTEKLRATKKEKYGDVNYNNRDKARQTCIEKYGVSHHWENKEIRNKIKETNLEKYGVEHIWSSEEIREKCKKTAIDRYGNISNHQKTVETMIKKYGSKDSLSSPEIKKKIQETNLKKYGSISPFGSTEVQEKVCKTNLEKYGTEYYRSSINMKLKTIENNKKRTPEEWRSRAIKSSETRSSLEIIENIKPDSKWEQSFIKSHPGCIRGPAIEYYNEGKKHIWLVDFEWEGKLYEVKNPFYFNLDFPQWKPEITWAKWRAGEELRVRWYLWDSLDMTRKFPIIDDLELFRNKCWVGRKSSPFDAWNNKELRFLAEENFASQLGFGGNLLKKVLNSKKSIGELILERFTIAKIAPRVTVMSKNEAIKWLTTSGLDLSQGVYDPCGGFGGRKEACNELGIEYEGYDVNPELIRLVGHSYQDLISMDPIVTNKIVFTSPPWNDKECWLGSNGSITEIHEKEWWYTLIQQKIKAPHYIFVNGAINDNKRNNGLFGQRNKVITKF
jgi:hypothetical protein